MTTTQFPLKVGSFTLSAYKQGPCGPGTPKGRDSIYPHMPQHGRQNDIFFTQWPIIKETLYFTFSPNLKLFPEDGDINTLL